MAEQRERWGCDAPAPEAVFSTSCARCGGQASDCPLCHGSGFVEVKRCPASQAAGMEELIEAYCERVRCEAWPGDGGMSDQCAFTVAAFRLMDGERRKIEEERRQAAQALR